MTIDLATTTAAAMTSPANTDEEANGAKEASDSLSKRMSQLEKTILGNSPPEPQSLQERIKLLEKEIADIKGAAQDKDSSKIVNNTLPRTVIPEVRRVGWSSFKSRYSPADGSYAIEALYVGSDFSDEIRREHQNRRRSVALYNHDGSANQLSTQDLGRRWMYRIRIQSRAVLAYLSQHLKQNWDDEIRTFIRPFRVLLTLHEDMKASLAELEEKWAGHERIESASKTPNPSDVTTSRETLSAQQSPIAPLGPGLIGAKSFPPEDSIAALREMRCYVEFIEQEVLPMKTRFADHTAENPPKVRWNDLCYLFEPGQYVYTPVDPTKKTGKSPKPGEQQTVGWQTVRKVVTAVSPNIRLKTPGRHRKKEKKKKPEGNESSDETDDDDVDYSDRFFICETDPEPEKGEYPLYLWCYHIDYDGHTFRPVFENMTIDYFHGERDVDSLVAYPLRYTRGRDEILKNLQLRGERFKEYVQAPRLYYKGRSLNPKDARHYDGEVIVDFEEALVGNVRWTPDWLNLGARRIDFPFTQDDFPIKQKTIIDGKPALSEITEIIQKDYGVESMDFNGTIKDDPFLFACQQWDKPGLESKVPPADKVDPVLLPQRMLAYILRERMFCEADVNRLQPLKKQLDAFDDLKIDRNNKRLVKSLVDSHFRNKEVEKLGGERQTNQDIIQGKANNLIILLHGVPGVGKTATAEAVADVNDKPLFPITCGDLGIDPGTVEVRLSKIFQLANRWNCVLLLDEADVFLAQRRTEDLKRNALVSVFLRILEYYSGILILTTNRVGTLDEAFQSRIHTMLYYPRLSYEQTKEIFLMNIKRLEAIEKERHQVTGEPPIEVDKGAILDFTDEHFQGNDSARWNGRQIRNAFQIAASMARSEWYKQNPKTEKEVPPMLNAHHFERVAHTTEQFRLYLKEARGKDNWELAEEHNERADNFNYRRSGYDRNDVHPGYPDRWAPRGRYRNGPPRETYGSYGVDRHRSPNVRKRRDDGREHDHDGRSYHYDSRGGHSGRNQSRERSVSRSPGPRASTNRSDDRRGAKSSKYDDDAYRRRESRSRSRSRGPSRSTYRKYGRGAESPPGTDKESSRRNRGV